MSHLLLQPERQKDPERILDSHGFEVYHPDDDRMLEEV